MKRSRWFWPVWLLAALMPVSGVSAEPITLRVSLQIPAANPIMGRGVVLFKEQVEKETEGAIRIEIYDKGKLYNDHQVVGAVQSGAIEMGSAVISQISKRLPAADIMEQPFLFNFEALTRAALSPESELRQLIDKAVLEKLGVHVLWWQNAGTQVLLSKGVDMAEPSRLEGKTVRVFSDTMASFTRHCGGIPQVLSITKVHDGMKQGTIEVAMIAPVAVETRQLWKVADTVTRTDHTGTEFLVIINARTWAGLNDRHKAVMTRAAKASERAIRDNTGRLEAKAFEFVRSKGMKVHELTPDQVAVWRACSAEVIDGYMSRGGELERQLLAAYGKLRTEPCCNTGPAGAFHGR
jgi:C4-dicarboxylate-binding protein DctP